MEIKIIVISDTHGLHRGLNVPDGDILIHGGDITRKGNISEVKDFNNFIGSLPHKYKIIIAGNHDFCLENNKEEAVRHLTNCTYLEDSGIEIEGINIWGSPWQPWFYDWAFNLQRGPEIKKKWDLIPQNTNVLITHGPPHKILDKTVRNIYAGCEELYSAIKRIKPKVHIFGHIHEGYGTFSDSETDYINASICTFNYKPVNSFIEYIYKKQ